MNKVDKNILTFIGTFIKSHRYSPSIRDIKDGLNISSTSVVDYHLKTLKQAGFINYTPHVARSIVVIKDIE